MHLINNTFQIHGKKTQRQQVSLNTKLNLSSFVQIGLCCPIQNHILKKQNIFREKFTHFPVIINAMKQLTFESVYESSIIFQSFIYTNIPIEQPSYAPTFFLPINTKRPIISFFIYLLNAFKKCTKSHIIPQITKSFRRKIIDSTSHSKMAHDILNQTKKSNNHLYLQVELLLKQKTNCIFKTKVESPTLST